MSMVEKGRKYIEDVQIFSSERIEMVIDEMGEVRVAAKIHGKYCDWEDSEEIVDPSLEKGPDDEDLEKEIDCLPEWECERWGDCEADYSLEDIAQGKIVFEGLRRRVCVDLNECEDPKEKEMSCTLAAPVNVENVMWCGEEYLEIYDEDTGGLVSRVRVDEKDKLEIGFTMGNFTGTCPSEDSDTVEKEISEIGPDRRSVFWTITIFLITLLLVVILSILAFFIFKNNRRTN